MTERRYGRLTAAKCAHVVDGLALLYQQEKQRDNPNPYKCLDIASTATDFAVMWLDLMTADGHMSTSDLDTFNAMVRAFKPSEGKL